MKSNVLPLLGAFAAMGWALSPLALPVHAQEADPALNQEPAASVEQPELPDDPSWLSAGRLVLGGRFSADVQESFVDLLVPMVNSDTAAIFLNLRGTFLEDREQEMNAGLVVRRLLPDHGLIIGLNAFYDQRWTENDNRFDQIGGGLEVLSRWVDLRANVYYPLEDEVVVSESTDVTTSSSGGQRVTTTSFFQQYEEALEGWDAEIGVWLPGLDAVAPTALYVGYFDFSSDFDDDDDLSGWKARLESRVSSQFTLDAEWFDNDELNQTEYFVGFRIHLPLDVWNGLRLGDQPEPPSLLAARMNEMVHRDFRIRTRVTEPVLVDQQEERTGTTASTPPPRAPAPDRPIIIPIQPPEPPPPPPPNCSIDPITGDVICI